MERDLGSDANPPPASIDKSRVLEVKPLKTLVPVFPNSSGLSSITTPQPSPFVCIPPSGPFPSGVQPFYPFLSPNNPNSHPTIPGPHPSPAQPNFTFTPGNIPAPIPLNSYRTPTPQANGSTRPKRSSTTRGSDPIDDDEYSDSQNPSNPYASGFNFNAEDTGNTTRKRAGRPKMKRAGNGSEFDIESLVNHFLASFKLTGFDDFRRSNGDKDTVSTVLAVYDLIRKKLTQLEESKDMGRGIARRPDLKAANLMMSKGIRTNSSKRIGHVPGIEVGDIFFFRMELCVVGLHAPSMAGIDYMSVKITADEEPVAVSIVSSGGYDDIGDDCDVLIYSGQGGVQRQDRQLCDQKLERGNLALEKSLHRANDVRVVRGIKDPACVGGKIYVYDGVYRIQESWVEKNKGCNVFKYKLVRVPGQPNGFSFWKAIQQWKDQIAPRPGLILPDLTSGAESLPVALVNDVDGEKGPAHFTYIPNLRYSRPFSMSKASLGCHCLGGCQPDDTNCPCRQKNEGFIPYSSIGVLLTSKSPIYECGPTCACPPNCRNRTSQAGVKARLEVFKTKNQGWGLRSWDPIRAGSFICEYGGDVIEGFEGGGDLGNENDDNYVFDATREYVPVHDSPILRKTQFPLAISAKNNGNVARFMNHSCSPNVFWQPVLRESGDNGVFVHVAFFAARHIPPMQELTYDYGKGSSGNSERGKKKKCFCGSVKCNGYFY